MQWQMRGNAWSLLVRDRESRGLVAVRGKDRWPRRLAWRAAASDMQVARRLRLVQDGYDPERCSPAVWQWPIDLLPDPSSATPTGARIEIRPRGGAASQG